MTITTENGEPIELTPADSHAGPGNCYSRQQINGTCVWIRRPGDRWHRCTNAERSWHATARLAELAASAADAFAALGAVDPMRPEIAEKQAILVETRVQKP